MGSGASSKVSKGASKPYVKETVGGTSEQDHGDMMPDMIPGSPISPISPKHGNMCVSLEIAGEVGHMPHIRQISGASRSEIAHIRQISGASRSEVAHIRQISEASSGKAKNHVAERPETPASRHQSKTFCVTADKGDIKNRLTMARNNQDLNCFLHGREARSLVRNPYLLYDLWSGGQIEDEFTFGSVLGEGGFGKVVLANHKTDGTTRAVKTMQKSTDTDIHAMQLNEVQTLLSTDHPHIVKLFRYYETDTDIKLVFEHCKGADLLDKIINGPMKERDAALALRHMLKALKYCHDKYFGHYDVKPENFMYSGFTETNLKMIDFGFSGAFMSQEGKVRGTISYMAPEVINGTLGPEADVWSCGAVLFAMLTTWEFTDLDPDGESTELMSILKTRFQDRRWAQERLKEAAAEKNFPADACDLLEKLLIHDRRMRPSVKDALSHPFVTTTYGVPIHDDKLDSKAIAVLKDLGKSLQEFAQKPLMKRTALLVLSHNVSCGDGLVKVQRVAYRKLDRTGSGELSVDSLEAGMLLNKITVPSDLDDLFTYIDTDKDGYICFVDLLAAFMPLSIQREEAGWKHVFSVLDVNKDGLVDANDLVHAFSYSAQDAAAVKLCNEAIIDAGLPPTGFSSEEFVRFMYG